MIGRVVAMAAYVAARPCGDEELGGRGIDRRQRLADDERGPRLVDLLLQVADDKGRGATKQGSHDHERQPGPDGGDQATEIHGASLSAPHVRGPWGASDAERRLCSR